MTPIVAIFRTLGTKLQNTCICTYVCLYKGMHVYIRVYDIGGPLVYFVKLVFKLFKLFLVYLKGYLCCIKILEFINNCDNFK